MRFSSSHLEPLLLAWDVAICCPDRSSGAVGAQTRLPRHSPVVRFIDDKVEIRAGDTVEWTNLDPVTPYTITFGAEPANPFPPSGNVKVDSDGALHAVITSPGDNVHSGFIMAALQDQTNQTPLGVTRFHVDFPNPGVFRYICALHDDLGMTGTVIVH
jgi:plastocyanin